VGSLASGLTRVLVTFLFVSWLARGNVPTRWALVATLLTWAAIPVLWSANEWGVLSSAEALWLLLVVAAWLLAGAGIAFWRRETELAVAVFVWSSVIPTVLGALLLLAYARDPGPGD